MKKIIGFMFLGLVSLSFADHTLNSVLDGRTNLTKAIKAAAAARGTPHCDYVNSIQIPVPSSADPYSTWRQVAFCYTTEANLKAAQEQLGAGGNTKWNEKGVDETITPLYGLPVASVIEVTYILEAFEGNGPGRKARAKKLLSLTVQ